MLMESMHTDGENCLVLITKIVYHPGKDNPMSCSPVSLSVAASPYRECITAAQVHVIAVQSNGMSHIEQLLQVEPMSACTDANISAEQSRDPYILQLIQCLNDGTLPLIEQLAKLVATHSPLFTLIDDILYYVDSKQRGVKRCVALAHLWNPEYVQ